MATDYSAFLDALSAALDTRDLALLGRDGTLPAITVGTLPVAIGKGVANGVAALNASGLPVDTSGRPMAVIGTASGQAADAGAVATAVAAANAAAAAASGAAATKVAAVNGTVTGAAFFNAMPTVADLVAMNLPDKTVFFTPGN